MEFSVSMCVYEKDNPNHFRTAVNSILQQTLPPTEVVLVVDGPVTDELNEVILDFENRRLFRVIRLPVNQGHGKARRVGIENCNYGLVALMDADDISVPERFEKQIACFEQHPELSVVGGLIEEFVGNMSNSVGKRIVPEQDNEIQKYLKKRCPMNQVTVMLKKSDVEKAGGYLEWYCDEDYYLWIRMYLENMTFYNLQETLVKVRIENDMYQRRGGWKYFQSEAKLQKYMLKQKIILPVRYLYNVMIRLCVQVLMPNRMRGMIFRKFARTK